MTLAVVALYIFCFFGPSVALYISHHRNQLYQLQSSLLLSLSLYNK